MLQEQGKKKGAKEGGHKDTALLHTALDVESLRLAAVNTDCCFHVVEMT